MAQITRLCLPTVPLAVGQRPLAGWRSIGLQNVIKPGEGSIRSGWILTIRAERRQQDNGAYRSEFRYGSLVRAVRLPASVSAADVTKRDAKPAHFPSRVFWMTIGVSGAGHLPRAAPLTRAGCFTHAQCGSHTDLVEPPNRPRSARRGMTVSAEALAQRVAERVIDLVVQAIDINALLQLVDLNALLARVDVNVPLKQMDLNALLKQVDLNEPLRQIDLNALLARVDVNAPLKQMDVNAPLKQIDLDELLKQVDVNAVLDRVDINDVVARIDMERLVEQTDLGAIIARSTGGIATEALDTVRSGAVGLDRRIDGWVTRLLRRKDPGPLAPRALLGPETQA